jgi:hypothetical protein
MLSLISSFFLKRVGIIQTLIIASLLFLSVMLSLENQKTKRKLKESEAKIEKIELEIENEREKFKDSINKLQVTENKALEQQEDKVQTRIKIVERVLNSPELEQNLKQDPKKIEKINKDLDCWHENFGGDTSKCIKELER